MKRAELHCHTDYSNIRLIDSINSIKSLIDYATEIGLNGLAITDHEILSAHLKALTYAEELRGQGKTPPKILLGNEIYLTDVRPAKLHPHFILIAKDDTGHHQLRELSSIAWMQSYSTGFMTRVDTLKKDLENVVREHPGHLIASTACIGGELSKLILALDKAERLGAEELRQEAHNRIVEFVLWCKGLFGEDFYFEVQPGTTKEQVTVNKRMVNLSKAFGVKMICTSDAHYLRKSDRQIHKSFLNSKEGDREVDDFYEFCYLHNEKEFYEEFEASDFSKEFVDEMFANTAEILDKVEDYHLTRPQAIPKVDVKDYEKKTVEELKGYPHLYNMFTSDDMVDRYWVNQCWEGMKEKGFDTKKEYLDELEHEADVKSYIGEKLGTNMFGYPVLLQHYFDRFWEAGSVIGVGRGSAAAALNHYLLGLTQLDPVEYNMPFFRYMNKENCGLGDIDIDVCSTKRPSIIKDIKQERYHYFNENVSEEAKKNLGAVFVGTFGTETTKAAVGTACRGYRSEEFPDGIDIDIAQYLSSLIPSERGFLWPIHDVIYGNEEKGRKPSKTFLDEANKFPGLIEIIEGIEGMISRRGIHASGLILLEDDPFEKTAFMKAPNGELTTQFDLGDCEAMGLTKLDILITQASDKIMKTLELLQADGVFDKEKSLREIYNESVHPDVMNLEDEEVWGNIKKGNVLSLFQFDTPIGGQGVRRLQPKNIQELSNCNALIRLMTGDDGENPIDHYERLMQGRDIWIQEMNQFHLTKEEQEAITPYLEESYGLGISQEQLMLVLMDKNICGFTLKDANKARKVVSKKKMNQIPALQKQVYEQACSKNMAEYVWQNVVKPQLGYAFSSIHSMSYTMIGYQTAYLSTKWPSVYWNTACLIVDSGSADEDNSGKGSNYDKIARAVGSITSHGVNVQLIDINESDFTFKPDANNNLIWYGLKAVDRVSDDTVKEIKAGRPYSGVKDFIRRCPQQKNIMISLVKSGAFDSLDNEWASKICPEEPRKAIMAYYLTKTANLKEKVTMQNFSTLLKNNLIPDYLKEEVDIWRYTAFLRDKKNGRRQEKTYLIAKEEINRVTEIAPDLDYGINNEYYVVFQKDWDKAYMGAMESVKSWLSNSQEEILKSLNSILFKEEWDKYAKGSISKWEMESLCYYYNEHELAHVNKDKYGVQDFYRLPENPKPIRFFKQYPIYALTRIVGTVIGKNKIRSTVTLLTVDGVVDVKMTKDYFANIDRQISEIQEDGKRKKVEASWATRGNLMMFTGYRRDNTFVCKKYSKTPGHQAYLITTIDKEGSLKLTHERADELE